MNRGGKSWWQDGIFYQIYPRSFRTPMATGSATSPASSIGCLISLALGIDAIWLSPVFPSPMADFGYDISDYTGIDPLFGTMADFDALVERGSRGGLKVILDLVPNHTSDRHPWFIESRGSRDNRSATGIMWRDPAAGWRRRRTTGCRNSAAAPGPSMPPPVNIIITPSSPSSRI